MLLRRSAIVFKDLEMQEILGEGSFGIVNKFGYFFLSTLTGQSTNR